MVTQMSPFSANFVDSLLFAGIKPNKQDHNNHQKSLTYFFLGEMNFVDLQRHNLGRYYEIFLTPLSSIFVNKIKFRID